MQPGHSAGSDDGPLIDSAEIVIGLVAPVGTDLSSVVVELTQVLTGVAYRTNQIRLSRQLRELATPAIAEVLQDVQDDGPADKRIEGYMNAGDKFRELFGFDAMARLAIGAIRSERKAFWDQAHSAEATNDRGEQADAAGQAGELRRMRELALRSAEPLDRIAYVLYQLKRPEEVRLLREVYGPAFILVAVHTPREERVSNLAERIARTRHGYHPMRFRAEAERLILRDEEDSEKPHGQKVSDTFHLADVFVSGSEPRERQDALKRFVELLFGDTLHTPTREEQGMFHAQAHALRSASLGRQVGAAIATEEGSVIALGANEVPKAGGGTYWPGDEHDRRDHVLGHDPSDRMRRDVLADILERLQRAGWLQAERVGRTVNELVDDALSGSGRIMIDAHFMNLIEFMRPVHAEMAALCDAAERGVAVRGTVLYVTTFPCHGCAKHIVAAGIGRVVYIEPYPKSLTIQLYRDSVMVDTAGDPEDFVHFSAFVGVAPRRFMDWFTMGKRKDSSGAVAVWDGAQGRARLGDWVPTLDLTWVRENSAYHRLARQVDDVTAVEGGE
jgi:deoxycytidylate deaminase